ncbi:MAG: class I SAM-dependent methyltransferase [Legionella sp.]|uniref:class I SAM-dependent methyltransferase n=1 Tax=Legionella sp. TaxID=459 RepID=UPI0039E395ED
MLTDLSQDTQINSIMACLLYAAKYLKMFELLAAYGIVIYLKLWMVGGNVIWLPDQYVLGNYVQTEVNELFRKSFHVQPFGNIVDIGCGDGQYSNLLASHLKHGHILGIDSSPEMIKHANQQWARENLSFEVHKIEEFHQPLAFDFALSFWCLHWTEIEVSFANIFHALKKGGRIYAVFSSFSDNSILQVWRELAKQGHYRAQVDRYINADNPNRDYLYRVLNVLARLPFQHIKLNLKTIHIYLPDIRYFKNLLLTMPFMKTFPKVLGADLIQSMLDTFQSICQRKYGNRLYYETRPIFLEALK